MNARQQHAAALAAWVATLDVLGLHRGRCAFCGDGDARHRVADAITERVLAGDDPEEVAEDYLDDHLRTRAVWEIVARTLAVERAALLARMPRDAWWSPPPEGRSTSPQPTDQITHQETS